MDLMVTKSKPDDRLFIIMRTQDLMADDGEIRSSIVKRPQTYNGTDRITIVRGRRKTLRLLKKMSYATAGDFFFDVYGPIVEGVDTDTDAKGNVRRVYT